MPDMHFTIDMSARMCEYCGNTIPIPKMYASYNIIRYAFRRYCNKTCAANGRKNHIPRKQIEIVYKPRKKNPPKQYHCVVCDKPCSYKHKFCSITCNRKYRILGMVKA